MKGRQMRDGWRIRLPQAVEQALGIAPGSNSTAVQLGAAVAIAGLMAAAAGLVWVTGGTQAAYLHLLYIPIFLAASAFGVVGGVVGALIAGLLVVGPFMPLDTATGQAQPVASWLFRTAVFVAFGVVAGVVIGRLRDQLRQLRASSLLHPNSRLPTQLALAVCRTLPANVGQWLHHSELPDKGCHEPFSPC